MSVLPENELHIKYAKELQAFIDHFTKPWQVAKLGGECGELMEAISKYEYGYPGFSERQIHEEFADVLVVLDQIRIMYNLNEEEIQQNYHQKVWRLLNRIYPPVPCDEL